MFTCRERALLGYATALQPERFKAVLSMLYLLMVTWITSFVMVIVHDRVPDMKRYPPLPDIFLGTMGREVTVGRGLPSVVRVSHGISSGDMLLKLVVSQLPAPIVMTFDYERASAQRSERAKSFPARPETLLRGLYLSNRWAD